jgi:sensitive to high expression protein 9
MVYIKETRITTSRQAARQAKNTYDEAIVRRSNSQREVNDLLQRKSNWTDSDVSRFTTLVRQDHLYEQGEVRAKTAVSLADDAVDREFSQLCVLRSQFWLTCLTNEPDRMRTILARYHEEQVWSDKIRSASTYGSLAALGLNMVVFILAIIIVEPWKRRRLAQTFEKKIDEMSMENTAMVDDRMKDLARHFVEQEKLLSEMIEASSKSSNSSMLESPKEVPVSAAERIVRAAKDREVATAFAASTITAAVIGWIARSWLR